MRTPEKHVRWLRDELGAWVAKGLITAEQGEAIRRADPEPGARLPWGTILPGPTRLRRPGCCGFAG